LNNKNMEGKRIFVIGSSNTDMVVKAARLPVPGETNVGRVFLRIAGWIMSSIQLATIIFN